MGDTTDQAVIEDIKSSVAEFIARLDAYAKNGARPLTPTAFNWTDGLSAVFPARLTMSQLLAIWEAMHEAAVYEPLGSKASSERPAYPDGDVVGACVCGSWPGGECLRCEWRPSPVADADGWITHDGKSQPVSNETLVQVKFRDTSNTGGNTTSEAGGYGGKDESGYGASWWVHQNLWCDIIAYRVVSP